MAWPYRNNRTSVPDTQEPVHLALSLLLYFKFVSSEFLRRTRGGGGGGLQREFPASLNYRLKLFILPL